MYVRQSSNPADSHPWQVRRNLPDQTYVVEGRYVSAAAAYAHVDRSVSLEEQVAAANAACAEWEKATFNLGSAFNHCAKLTSLASEDVQQAINDGIVRIAMASEYDAPRLVLA